MTGVETTHDELARVIETKQTTPVGFEPTRGDHIGLAGRRLSHSAKVSDASCDMNQYDEGDCNIVCFVLLSKCCLF